MMAMIQVLLVSAITGKKSPRPLHAKSLPLVRYVGRKRGSREMLHEGKRRRLGDPSTVFGRFQALERLFLRLQRSSDNWLPVAHRDGVTLWQNPEMAMIMGRVELPVDLVCAKAALLDDYGGFLGTCFPKLIASVESRSVGHGMRILAASLKGFWPVPPRDCRLLERSRPLDSSSGYISVGASLESPSCDGFVRASVSLLGMLIEPTGFPGTCSRLTVLIKADPRGFIPKTLADRILQDILPSALAHLPHYLRPEHPSPSPSPAPAPSEAADSLRRISQRLDAVEGRLRETRSRSAASRRAPLNLAALTPWILSGSAMLYILRAQSHKN